MSAYLVSEQHIDLIVAFASTPRARYAGDAGPRLPLPPRAYGLDFGSHNANPCGFWGEALPSEFSPCTHRNQLGQGLWRANWDSLEARYRDRAGDLFGNGAELALYRAKPVARIDVVNVLKQLDCFDYQACEVSDYAGSWAAEVTRILRKEAIRRLPGYDDAPWGV